MKIRHILLFLVAWATALCLKAADPTATLFSARQCEGSLTPYPTAVESVGYPDSLVPVFINHVGRHGSRYPASSANCVKLSRALHTADSLGTITELGHKLMSLTDRAIAESTNRWGALDSLGMAEQRAIATRMYRRLGRVFTNGATVQALSSYSPRSMMSMFSFVHQLDRMNNQLNFVTNTGRPNSYLMRPFDTSEEFRDYLSGDAWRKPYEDFFTQNCPTEAISRALGRDFPYDDADHWRDLAITEYYVLAGMNAAGIECDLADYFTSQEYNALWSCFNLRQYLQRSASTVSTVPAEIASALILNLLDTTDQFLAGESASVAVLRFGHAETLLPLLSLLRLPGCYYLTNYFDTVAMHWRDFDIVPMAANLQMILFKSKSGRYYLRTDLNERPLPLIPGREDIYVPWGDARDYMMRCVPLYLQ